MVRLFHTETDTFGSRGNQQQDQNDTRKDSAFKKERQDKKPTSLELVFLLDTSGSMYGSMQDLIGGFNAMIEEQKKKAGECKVSLVTFSNDNQVRINRKDLKKIHPLKLNALPCGGMTALYDAAGRSIDYISGLHKQLGGKAPEKTMFVIMTDGLENASRVYSQRLVKYMIKDMEENHGWNILFTAANIDTQHEAGMMGVPLARSASFHQDTQGYQAAFDSFSRAVGSVRETGVLDTEWSQAVNMDYRERKE